MKRAALSRFISLMRKAPLVAASGIVAALVGVLALFPAGWAPAGVYADLSPGWTRGETVLPEPHTYGDSLPAKGKFLVANRSIVDPRFQETVVLLIAYDVTGATGLIINRPTKVPLAELLPSVQGLKSRSDVVYYGGPVEGQRAFMLIRSDKKLEEADNVFFNVYVSMSRHTLESMLSAHKTRQQLRVYSGYAGWMPGQLNREILHGDWHVVNADANTIFEKKSSDIWREFIIRSSAIEVWKQGEKELQSS